VVHLVYISMYMMSINSGRDGLTSLLSQVNSVCVSFWLFDFCTLWLLISLSTAFWFLSIQQQHIIIIIIIIISCWCCCNCLCAKIVHWLLTLLIKRDLNWMQSIYDKSVNFNQHLCKLNIHTSAAKIDYF